MNILLYTTRVIDTEDNSIPTDINRWGMIIGYHYEDNANQIGGFVFDSLSMSYTALPSVSNQSDIVGDIDVGFRYSMPLEISDNGMIIGASTSSPYTYMLRSGVTTTYPSYDSFPVGINNYDTIVFRDAIDGQVAGIIQSPWGTTIVQQEVGLSTFLTGVNNQGDVSGWLFSDNGAQGAFVRHNDGSIIPLRHYLGESDFDQSVSFALFPQGVNDRGYSYGFASPRSSDGSYNDALGYAALWNPQGDMFLTITNQYSEILDSNPLGTAYVGTTYGGIDSLQSGFVMRNGNPFDLNSVSNSSIHIQSAYGVNQVGQIVASGSQDGRTVSLVLDPVMQGPAQHQFDGHEADSIVRFGEWQDGQFVRTSSANSSIQPIYVLVHGWQPHEVGNVTHEGELIGWGPFENWYSNVARSIAEKDPQARILGYGWHDDAATHSLLNASIARDHTTEHGRLLGQLLSQIIQSEVPVVIIGHSHGARVSLQAAYVLEQHGIDVSKMVFLDSPDHRGQTNAHLAVNFVDGSNYLEDMLVQYQQRFGIGGADTKVENYITVFGQPYYVQGVENHTVYLEGSIASQHSALTAWYAETINNPQTTDVFTPQYTLSAYERLLIDSVAGYQVHRSSGVLIEQDLSNLEIRMEGVHEMWQQTLLSYEGAISLWFDYTLDYAPEDGSELSVWIDETEILEIPLTNQTGITETVFIDGNIDAGLHYLSFALHGNDSTRVRIGNIQQMIIPEPQTVMLLLSAIFIWMQRFRRRR